MSFTNEVEKLKNEINELKKKQIKIEKLIEKQEENEIFDNSLYDKINEIEEQITKLESELLIEEETWGD